MHRKGHRDYWQDRLLDPETGLKMLNFSFLPPEWCTDVAQFTARLQGSPFYPNFADAENQVVNNFFYYTRMPPTKDVAALQTQQARAGVKHRDDIGRVASTQVESGGASSSSSASSTDTYQGLLRLFSRLLRAWIRMPQKASSPPIYGRRSASI